MVWRMDLPQFDACLLFDAAQRPDGDVALWMRHRYPAFLGRMLELSMTAFPTDLVPSVRNEGRYDLPALHTCIYTH